ncbi:MAG: type II secretion system protein GspM [Porticoccaceae bacterium]
MTDFMGLIEDFFSGLEPRERLLLKIASVVFVVALVVILVQPKWEAYNQFSEQRESLKADMDWLQKNQSIVATLVSACPKVNKQQISQLDSLKNLVLRNQLKVKSSSEKKEIILLTVSGNDSNKFIALMHQIACQGYRLMEVSLTADQEEASLLIAEIGVQRVN